ncbi:hypothetical protein L2755_09525 [Shewanella abyssi]|uniref:multiheme c-type cytochrome n=1 Tax=Shewanella abyssi TaxID=311789 RepID=UPI00200D578E|nr:hypothetical protein [Shewanella abyssi]MCL1049859.1 hypothetical protein [Shewanella abyssi]
MMINRYKLATAVKSAIGIGALSLALVGCGSDGKDGEDGNNGEIAVHINDVTAVKTQVELASYDETNATLTIEFNFTNLNGVTVTGLEDLTDPLRVSFGRMGTRAEAFLPYDVTDSDGNSVTVDSRGDGEREIWLSYRNKSKDDLVTGTDNWRPNRNCPDEQQCLEYLGGGKYRITAPDIVDTKSLDYGYDATQVQGIYLMTYGAGANKVKNVEAYYWEPATERPVSSPKSVLESQTCTSCHVGQDHIRHGNYGNTADGCLFCHTDYTQYAGTGSDEEGNEVNFTVDGSIKGLVHAIHTGATEAERRDVAKFETVIGNSAKNPVFGYKYDRAAQVDEEGNPLKPVNYPAATASCESCHVQYTETEETLPEGVTVHALDWFKDMDADSCQSCHGDYHYGGRTTTDDTGVSYVGCVDCHTSNDGNTRGGAFRHFAGHDKDSRESAIEAGKLIETSYSNIVWNSDAAELSFTVNLIMGEQEVTSAHVPRVSIYANAIDASAADAYLASRPSVAVTPNADGSFNVVVDATGTSYTLPALADAIENGADLALSASFSACFKNKESTLVELDSEGSCSGILSANAAKTAFLKLDGSAGAERASAVNYENCASCHNNDMVVRKGAPHYRNADLHTCAQCHEAGDYNAMIVRVHGTFGKAHGREDVQSLVDTKTCTACHDDGNYSLENARSTPMRWNRKDQTFSSPQAGVCASCHVSNSYDIGGGKDSAQSHIENMGGVVADTFENAQMANETCLTCHSAEKIAEKHMPN